MSVSENFKFKGADDASIATVLPVVDRLRATVDAENRDIASRTAVDYRTYTQRKNQGLFELAKLQSLIAAVCRRPAVAAAFADLSVKLELNRRLLGAQLKAARTVADIVARAIRDHQSDGTYSAHPWRDDGR